MKFRKFWLIALAVAGGSSNLSAQVAEKSNLSALAECYAKADDLNKIWMADDHWGTEAYLAHEKEDAWLSKERECSKLPGANDAAREQHFKDAHYDEMSQEEIRNEIELRSLVSKARDLDAHAEAQQYLHPEGH